MLNAPTPEKTRVCPNCSDPELGLKDKFCSSCGTAVPLLVLEEEVEEEEEEASVQDSQQEETEYVAEEEEQPAPSEPSSPQPAPSRASSPNPRQCSACLRKFLKHRDAVNHLRGSLSCKESGGTVCFIKRPKVRKRAAELDKEEEEEVVKVQGKDGSIEKVVRVIRIVRQNIGRVIGVGGENINEVQNVTDTKIDVRDGEDEMNTITITGTEESVNQAVSMVKQLATGRSRPRSWKNESEDRRQKRKPAKEYDETAELFGLNPYKRAGGRGRGMRNFRESREPPFMASREPPFMGSREPPFMGSREPPFMGSRESSIERAKWSGGADRRGGMGEGRFENDMPPWARKTFRGEADGWGGSARSRPSRPDGFYGGGGFNGGRDMGGDDFMETRGWGGPPKSSDWGGPPKSSDWGGPPKSIDWGSAPKSGDWGGPPKSGDWGGPPESSDWGGPPKSSDWVTTTRDTGGWGKSKPEPEIDDVELPKPKPKPKKYKRDEVAELFGIHQPPPDGRRRWAPYRREAVGRGRWASR